MANRFLSNLRINDAYTLPASDGTSGQVISTDGAGNLSFTDASTGGAPIMYKDDFIGDGSTVLFQLANPVTNIIQTQVYIDGTYQEKETYSVSGQDLTFVSAPPSGTSIEVISLTSINFSGDFVLDTLRFTGGTGDQGILSWNTEDETLDLIVSPDVTYQIGQELGHTVRNLSGTTLNNGAVVRVTGASGNKITVDLADNTAELGSSETFAVVTETISNNSTGKVTTEGLVRGLNTSAFAEGVAIWLGTNGAFTDTKPLTPNHLVHIGWVVRSHATEGAILVKVSNGWEMEELHDVLITSVSDKDMLVWNNTQGYWENSKTLGDITTGNITTSGTVDGVDISAFKTDYDSHTHTESEITDFGNYLTNVTHDTVNTKLVVTKRDGTTTDLNLAQYIDDTNLARLTSGSLDAATGIATFTRDDATTFTVDFSALFDDTDTNDFLTGASFNTADGVLTLNVSNQNNVTVDLDGRYLESYTETDPVFSASAASGITSTNISNWNTSYAWGDHSSAGYLTSYTETDTLATVTGRGNTTSSDLTTGRLTLGNNVSTGGFGSFNDYQIILYKDTSATTSYGLGIESGTLMFHTNGVYKFYANNVVKATISNSGDLTLTGTISASGYNNSNWDTAYGWGNHAGLYLPIGGKAADSELLDGIDSSNFFRTDGTYPNTDMNDTVEGYWHVASGSANLPVNYYGHRWDYDHVQNGQWVFQMYSPTSGDVDLWFRQKRDFAATAWQKVITSGNIGSQSVSYATNAGTLDSIDSTQFLRSDASDTFTGDYLGFSGLSLGIANNNNDNGYGTYFRGNNTHFVLGLTNGNTLYMNYGNSSGTMRTYGTMNHEGNTWMNTSRNIYSPRYYDDDTNYYVDPNDWSNLYNLNLGGAKHTYLTINPGNSYEAMVRYIGGSGNSFYVGKRTSTQTIGSTDAYHVYSETLGATVGGYDSAGNHFGRTSSRAPIFYDSDNTAYYVDPANSNLSVKVYGEISNSNAYQGNLQPGALNIGRTDTNYRWDGTTWASDVRVGILANCQDYWEFAVHDSGESVESVFYYNSGDNMIYMGRDIGWGTTPIVGVDSFRAPVFYDSNDTNYFINGNSSSRLYNLYMPHLGNGSWNLKVNDGGSENWRAIHIHGGVNDHIGIGYHTSSRSIFGVDGVSIHFDETDSFRLHTNGWDTEFEVLGGGEAWLKGGLRASIYYDNNDTTWYTDPASRSILNSLQLGNAASDTTNLKLDVQGNMAIRGNSGLYYGVTSNNFNSWTTRMYASSSTQYFNAQNFIFDNQGYGSTTFATVNSNGVYANVYWDSSNTNFYVDAASTSKLAEIVDSRGSRYIANYHSGSDFADGTLVTTDIPASVTNGASFVIEVTGKSYSSTPPFSFIAQGYLYANTIINTSGVNNGDLRLTYIKVMELNGVLCFWWPRVSYWNSFEVMVRDAGGISINRVTGISNSSDPAGATKKIQINLSKSVTYDTNINSGGLWATTYYDANDSTYYIDPNGTSVLNTVSLGAQTWRSNIAWNAGVNININGECSFDMYSGQFGVWNSNTQIWSILAPHEGQVQIGQAGNRGLYVYGDITASILYDAQNTVYHSDPAGTSKYAEHVVDTLGVGGIVPAYPLTVSGSAWIDGGVGIETIPESAVSLKVQGGSNGALGLKILGGSYASSMAIETPTYGSGISFKHTGAFNANFAAFTYGTNNVGSITVSSTSTAYNTSSDYRLKENVVPMVNALERVSLLKPSRFNFIGDDKTVDGFIAHEAQEVVPEAVTGEKDGIGWDGNPEYQGIDQSKLVPLLVGAIQELKAEVEALKQQLNVTN